MKKACCLDSTKWLGLSVSELNWILVAVQHHSDDELTGQMHLSATN